MRALPLARILPAACALVAACAEPKPVAPVRDYELEADALLHGLGPTKTCRNDRDCIEGPVQAVCALGTCFGLLTSDEPAARALLLERLHAADAGIHEAARKPLLAALALETASRGQRIAAVEGLGAVAGEPAAEPVIAALRAQAADADEALAVAARLALGRLGDAGVRAVLLEDLALGTELLRAEAARALAPARRVAAVRSALIAALADASPVVQLAALRALAPQAADADLVEPLTRLVARTPAYRYEAERTRMAEAKR